MYKALLRARGTCTLFFFGVGLLSGCERLLDIQDPVAGVADGGGVVDGQGVDDGGTGPYGNLSPTSPLLLSEIALAPNAAEMIEIYNTSNQEVDLSTYYVSDNGNYFLLPAHGSSTSVDQTDFIVKFPAAAKIAGHGVIVIAVDMPANFAATYGMSPSYSLADGSMQTVVMNGVPNLTNGGEPIVLFQWDGNSDLVRDVDIMLAGVPTGDSNAFPNKSGVQQDGPDTDTRSSTYALDRHTIAAQPSAPGPGLSTKRIKLEASHEVQDGHGNGQSGDDETSEDTSVTWDTAFTAPTPFAVDIQQ